jgi:Nif-specific regulatory protein
VTTHGRVRPNLAARAGPFPAESLTALTEAAAAISSTLQLDSLLQTTARLACAVARAEASTVFLLDSRRRKLVAYAATGHRRDVLLGREFDAHLGIPGQVVQSGASINVADARAHSRFCKEIDDIGSLRTRSILAAPMVYRAEVIGVIEVVNRLDGTDFTESDLKVLQIFATLAASATQNARTHEDLKQRFEGLRDAVMKPVAIIGASPGLRTAIDLCNRVAPSSASVLILGETGTGKELCARHIHTASRRRDETFVAINCATLSETLLESELFGHEKGAFTDAHAQRRGWFELANHGTLFLDEIADISRSTQAKLLRVLQEKEFVRVGGTKPIPCDVRLIAATNRDLKTLIVEGSFREDLYYRLNVFPIRVPPLRERQEDIPGLADYFVRRSTQEFGSRELQVAPETMAILTQYRWPGNIRELQNVIERAVLMADSDSLLPCHLPPDMEADLDGQQDLQSDPTLQGQEKTLILKTLKEHNWNQSQTARTLGITRDHLRHRIRKYGIQRPPDRGVVILPSQG